LAYLWASAALLLFGSFVFYDSALKLVKAEHPPIGVIELFGEPIWLGWAMLAALAYSGIPPIFLGRAKRKLADSLHDKVLYADAEMNRADWMTAGAGMLGILGIGVGLWWADAVAAIFISLDIVRDGWRNVRSAHHDLMDARPRRHDASEWHPLVAEIEDEIRKTRWVEEGTVRLREEGHVFTGEILVVPRDETDLVENCRKLVERVTELSWKLYDIVVVPVPSIDVPSPGAQPEAEERELGATERSGSSHS
jgi:divalent metal cation (Fe/Co/Zn/Cd) transporter